MNRRLAGWALVLLGVVGLVGLVSAWSRFALARSGNILWVAVMPAILLALGIGLLRAPGRDAPARPDPEPVPVPPAPDAAKEAAGRSRPVHACMRCGAAAMQPAPLGADALFAQWRCARCGFRGQPLRFDDEEAYAAFVRGLHADREAQAGDRIQG